MKKTAPSQLQRVLDARFDDAPTVPDCGANLDKMAQRGSCRAFEPTPVPKALFEILCAVALSSPTKSDLQQRDIVLMTSPDRRKKLADLVPGQDWVAEAPMLVVFCGNNRRQRLWHDWHDIPFANDHLDAFFNASVDAGIALGAFVNAAEAVGLGCCPISAIRNESAAVSDLLELPDHVFPIAGLAVGYPSRTPRGSQRLPLSVTVHHDRYSEDGIEDAINAYDSARMATQPFATQRFADTLGQSDSYGWSLDKARQYSQTERGGFGAFIRKKGFRLD